jgi:hypothetical protein
LKIISNPENSKEETIAAIAKGAVSIIPIVGGIVSEVGNLYLNPIEKRKQRWVNEVTLAINEINQQFAILPEQLEMDERFISFLYQTTILALKNHQKEKINSLRNALVSSANPNEIGEDVAFQFLRYIDELTPSHLHLLACLNKHIGQFARFENLEQVYGKFSELSSLHIDRTTFRSFLHDLDARFLIRIGDLEDLPEFASKISFRVTESSSTKTLEVTSLGRMFLDFIHLTSY